MLAIIAAHYENSREFSPLFDYSSCYVNTGNLYMNNKLVYSYSYHENYGEPLINERMSDICLSYNIGHVQIEFYKNGKKHGKSYTFSENLKYTEEDFIDGVMQEKYLIHEKGTVTTAYHLDYSFYSD